MSVSTRQGSRTAFADQYTERERTVPALWQLRFNRKMLSAGSTWTAKTPGRADREGGPVVSNSGHTKFLLETRAS